MIQNIRNDAVYLSKKNLSKKYDMCFNTVTVRTNEIKDQIGKRYREMAIIEDGNLLLVNEYVFMDWLKYRKQIQKNIKTEPFNPRVWAAYTGN